MQVTQSWYNWSMDKLKIQLILSHDLQCLSIYFLLLEFQLVHLSCELISEYAGGIVPVSVHNQESFSTDALAVIMHPSSVTKQHLIVIEQIKIKTNFIGVWDHIWAPAPFSPLWQETRENLAASGFICRTISPALTEIGNL